MLLFFGGITIYAQSEEFFTALNSVFQPPAFRTAWRDEKKKTVAVKEFLRLVGRLDATDGGVGKRHGGISPGKDFIPPQIPPKEAGAYGFFQPSPNILFSLSPCQE